VKHVLDIVDLTDKSIKGSERQGMDLGEYSNKYLKIFLEDAQFLNISQDNIYVKASENIEEMLKIVEKLVDKNYAYEKLHSVYYDISKLTDYGVLSNIDIRKTRPGKTIDLDEYEKDSPMDFALLRRANLGELKRGIYYKTKWGNVRPGWHLECSAISNKYLGATYDIHISGADETFPHCENILAINKAISGKSGANYWINAELVMVDGKKMSRSLNNALPLVQLRQSGYSGRDIRFFLLAMHYRKPLNYSDSALRTAKNTVKKINILISRLSAIGIDGDDLAEVDQLIYDLKNRFVKALDDDINIAGVLSAIFDFMSKINPPLAQGMIMKNDARKILTALVNINEVLGVMDFEVQVPRDEISGLIAKREDARKKSDWHAADLLRTQLALLGVDVLDTPQGAIWRLK
jgi:cysteinyl-tRNA synthetase